MFEIVFIMIQLHGVDGREIDISVDEITSIHCKVQGKENKQFTDGVNAIVSTTDGKLQSVVETCQQIRELLPRSDK